MSTNDTKKVPMIDGCDLSEFMELSEVGRWIEELSEWRPIRWAEGCWWLGTLWSDRFEISEQTARDLWIGHFKRIVRAARGAYCGYLEGGFAVWPQRIDPQGPIGVGPTELAAWYAAALPVK